MDFILKTAKRKLPLHENSFVKATAPNFHTRTHSFHFFSLFHSAFYPSATSSVVPIKGIMIPVNKFML